jgi:hypothetical protein
MAVIAYTLPDYQITKTKVSYPLSLEMIKRHLRLHNDFSDDDDYIMELLYSATQMVENYMNKSVAKTLNTLRIDDFNNDVVQIYEGNFLSLSTITDENSTSLLSSVVQTSAHYDYFTIEFDGQKSADPLTLEFYTGFELETTPELLKQAIMIQVSDFYDNNRSSYNWNGVQDSKIFERILNQYASYRF